MRVIEALWVKIKENPAATLQLLQVALGALVVFEVLPFDDAEQAGIMATAAAVLNLVLALAVRSVRWPLITAAFQAAVPLAVEFGWGATDQQIGAIYAVVAAVGAWFVREMVTPETKLPALRAAQNADGVFEVEPRPDADVVDPPSHRRRDPSAGGSESW